jgi:hypothetical protein
MTKKQRQKVIAEIRRRERDCGCVGKVLLLERDPKDMAAAIVGTVACKNGFRVAYLASKVIEEFMRMNNWTYDEAVEWYDYNTVRAMPYYEKENCPILIDDLEV